MYCDHFYVTLLSDTSLDTHTHNTQASFKCDLAQPIDLGSTGNRWEVGLCELTTAPTCTGIFKPTSIAVPDAQIIKITTWPSVTKTAGTITYSPIVIGADIDTKIIVGEHLQICCDVIAPQLIGTDLVRCLRTIDAPSEVTQHTFQRVYYMPVEKTLIRDISIQLLTRKGKWWVFKDSRHPTKVVLHFRRVRNVT